MHSGKERAVRGKAGKTPRILILGRFECPSRGWAFTPKALRRYQRVAGRVTEVKAGGVESLLDHSTWHTEPHGAGLGFQHVTLWKSSRTFRQEIVTPPYF